MNDFFRFLAHLLFVFYLFIFVIVPNNKYSWLREIDPSITVLPVDNNLGNRTIFILLLLISVIVAQLGVAFTAKKRKDRVVSIVFILIAIVMFFIYRLFQNL